MSLADADALLLSVLRTAVTEVNGLPVAYGTMIPYNLLERLPFCVARRFGGEAVDPRFLDRATVDVQTWAASRGDAYDFAAALREALHDAATNQTVYTQGHISAVREVSAPAELRDESTFSTTVTPGEAYRFQATYSLFLRPATV